MRHSLTRLPCASRHCKGAGAAEGTWLEGAATPAVAGADCGSCSTVEVPTPAPTRAPPPTDTGVPCHLTTLIDPDTHPDRTQARTHSGRHPTGAHSHPNIEWPHRNSHAHMRCTGRQHGQHCARGKDTHGHAAFFHPTIVRAPALLCHVQAVTAGKHPAHQGLPCKPGHWLAGQSLEPFSSLTQL